MLLYQINTLGLGNEMQQGSDLIIPSEVKA